MRTKVIADTGVIVALLDNSDQFHVWAQRQAANLLPPFLTCEVVIAEASHLLRFVKHGPRNLLAFIEQGFLQIDFALADEVSSVAALMQKYVDVPMDLADACLVRMSELVKDSLVFTLDTDFWVYRKYGKEQIPLVIPDKAA